MKKYTLVSGFLDRERELIITPDYIAYENNDAIGNTFTKLLQPDVIALKYRLELIVWYKFHVGKKFSFALKDKHGKELQVVVKNFFGLRKNFDLLCGDIVSDLQQYFLIPIADHYISLFLNSSPITLGLITLDQVGIRTPRYHSHGTRSLFRNIIVTLYSIKSATRRFIIALDSTSGTRK